MSDATRSDDGLRRDGDPGADRAARMRQTGDDMRRTTHEAEGQARAAASSAAGAVRREAEGTVEDLKAEGAELAEAARQRGEQLAEQGQEAGASQAETLARAARRAADELEGASPQVAGLVRDAASSVDGFARTLRERGPGELIHQVQDFARRQPMAFFGASVLAGFAVARFARSSARHHDGPRYDGPRHDGPRHDGPRYASDRGSAGPGMGAMSDRGRTGAADDVFSHGSKGVGGATPHDRPGAGPTHPGSAMPHGSSPRLAQDDAARGQGAGGHTSAAPATGNGIPGGATGSATASPRPGAPARPDDPTPASSGQDQGGPRVAGAPGWVPEGKGRGGTASEAAQPSRPATMPSATLGGAAAAQHPSPGPTTTGGAPPSRSPGRS